MMRFKRRLAPQVTMNMVPMIDVVFQLVLFFMVSTTLILTPAIKLILPSSSTSEPLLMEKLVITVVSREEVYLNKDRFTLDGLNERLARLTAEEKKDIQAVVLEGDRAISYSLLIEVLDVLRDNGFKGVNMRTRESPL
jgi:biopolymer transport protein ExbD